MGNRWSESLREWLRAKVVEKSPLLVLGLDGLLAPKGAEKPDTSDARARTRPCPRTADDDRADGRDVTDGVMATARTDEPLRHRPHWHP